MKNLGRLLAEWGPLAVAAVACAIVALHTRALSSLGPRELTLILCALTWLGTAAAIAVCPGRRRLADRLGAYGVPGALGSGGGGGRLVVGHRNRGRQPQHGSGDGVGRSRLDGGGERSHLPAGSGVRRRSDLGAAVWSARSVGLGSGVLSDRLPASLDHQAYEASYSVIQNEPDCAQYDPELSYRLRPGDCVFENVEFRTHYRVNSFGVRDDEASLRAPRVVMLGDSYTMGWGVEEDETYASLLERSLDRRTLNAGISSYGTVRELMLLSQIDRRELETIVLQYCPNDDYENRSYLVNSNELPIQSEQEYNASVAYQVSMRRFHPLRIPYKLYETLWAEPALNALHGLGWPQPWTAEKLVITRPEAAEDFLAVLQSSPVDLTGFRIVLFELSWGIGRPSGFLEELEQRLARLPSRDWRTHIEIVDVLPALTIDELLPIDRHLNAQGQRKVADQLLPYVR